MKIFDIIMRKSKLHLDCFTNKLSINTYTPITLANKHYPDWWREMPKSYKTDNPLIEPSTIKRCTGFIEFYQNAAALPLWTDMKIRVGKDSTEGISWLFSRSDALMEIHDKGQWQGFVDDGVFQHVKIRSPWLFSCKEDVRFAFVGNNWEFPDVMIPPGVINFKYQATTSVNMFVRYTGDSYILNFNSGKSLANIIPLTEKELVVHSHYDPERFAKLDELTTAETSFVNLYKKNKALLKAAGTCPYHLIRK